MQVITRNISEVIADELGYSVLASTIKGGQFIVHPK